MWKLLTRRTAAVLATIAAPISPATAERLPVRQYTVANGLAQDRVRCIVPDSRGFLSPATTGELYLSADQFLSSNDPLLATFEIPALAAGTSAPSLTVQLAASGFLPAGTYDVWALIDVPHVVTEYSEANNAAFTTGTRSSA